MWCTPALGAGAGTSAKHCYKCLALVGAKCTSAFSTSISTSDDINANTINFININAKNIIITDITIKINNN